MKNNNNVVVLLGMPGSYSAGQARRVAEVSQRCLDYWNEKGIVKPSCAAAGKGAERKFRRYSYNDLVRLIVVQRLRDAGLSLQRIRKGIGVLRSKGRNEPLDVVLITDGKTLIHSENDKLKDVLKNGQLVFAFVAVEKIRGEVDQSLLQMRRDEEENRRKLRSG